MNRSLDAVISVMAVGHDVTIKINSIDIGVEGQKVESLKLFSLYSPMARVLPEDMKKQICLQEGENTITIDCKCTAPEASDLFIDLLAKEQFVSGAKLFALRKNIKAGAEKSFKDVFTL